MRGGSNRDKPNHVLVARSGEGVASEDVAGTSNVLGVTYSADAERWLRRWQSEADQVAVVSPGERSRSAAAASGGTDDVFAGLTAAVETVADASDVARVGELVNEYLVSWRGTGDTTVVVDDLSGLLEHVSTGTAFRLLHAVLARGTSTDARVVVGIDPEMHPPHVVDTFAELFEDVRV